MEKKLLAFGCVVALMGCGPAPTVDGGMRDTGTVVDEDVPGTDAPGTDAPSTDCTGTDGLPCLAIEDGAAANMACTPTAPSGDERNISFNLIKRGATSTNIAGSFEVWTGNVIGTDCAAAADCFELTDTAAANVTADIGGSWYAYSVPANAAAMTFPTVGYNRAAAAAGGTDTITAIDSVIFMAAIGLIRPGFTRDVEAAILLGDAADCDGEPLSGVTVRLFETDGTEILQGTGPTDMGIAYRANGSLPDADLETTDDSGGYAGGNIPLPADGLVNVVTYGTLTNGGAREPIGCEVVSVGEGVVTILSLGPTRSDYPAGSFCAMVAAGTAG